mgnify:CR=1 FL=1
MQVLAQLAAEVAEQQLRQLCVVAVVPSSGNCCSASGFRGSGDLELHGWFVPGTGATNPAVDYSGGVNNADNSGTLRYVRIEFAGCDDATLRWTPTAAGSGC